MGDDSNVDINITPKGTGEVNIAAGLNVSGVMELGGDGHMLILRPENTSGVGGTTTIRGQAAASGSNALGGILNIIGGSNDGSWGNGDVYIQPTWAGSSGNIHLGRPTTITNLVPSSQTLTLYGSSSQTADHLKIKGGASNTGKYINIMESTTASI